METDAYAVIMHLVVLTSKHLNDKIYKITHDPGRIQGLEEDPKIGDSMHEGTNEFSCFNQFCNLC